MSPDSPAAITTQIHVWEHAGAASPEALSAWVSARLDAHKAALDALIALAAPRTVENTLALYDIAIEQLNLAGCQAGLLNSVAQLKPVRDQAQAEAQRIAQAGSALSLNRGVYDALSAIDLAAATPATRHYVERTLLGYRLAGVDRDQPTRDRLQALHEQATRLSLDFSRNIQEGGKTIEASLAELDGLPTDYVARRQPNAEGVVTLTTDQPDMLPVMTFARSQPLRERMFRAYNTRAYPANQQILLDLLATRQQIADILGFRSWADLATADQMMGSAANARNFIDKLNQASADGAKREHAQILAFARRRQPEIAPIDIASRAYWYEQFRRSAFDFDSQAVRPYFPYAQVQAGVLSTASRLFKVEFRPSTSPAWHPSVSVWEVFDAGELRGRFYLDMHPREGKDKWFSAHPVVTGVRNRYLPEAALICNFPEPKNFDTGAPDDRSSSSGRDPGLMQYTDVVTYLHEFGHLMHALLGGHTEWAGLSGFSTEGDFVEVPSQTLEEFFHDDELLQSFAKHYQTGSPLPTTLLQNLKRASSFGRADWVRSQLYDLARAKRIP